MLALAACLLAAFTGVAAQAGKLRREGGARVPDASHLDAGGMVRVELGGTASANRIHATLPIGGRMHTLRLHPHSVRAEDYRLVADTGGGVTVELDPGPVRTWRGTVEGIPQSAVAASISDDGIHGLILLPDQPRLWIEPAPSDMTEAGGHVLYSDLDVVRPAGTCAAATGSGFDLFRNGAAQAGAAGDVLHYAELAIDADVEYVGDFLTLEQVEEQINSIINAVNLQYERDLSIRHFITRIILRTAEPDPYSSTASQTLLSQLRNEWETVHRNVPRDLAQLFTGKNLDGTPIGVAWWGGQMETICDEWGYSVVESNCVGCRELVYKTDLSAHELGHNWGADHCTCSDWTMNASITAANQFHPESSIPEMLAFRDGLSCLDLGDELLRLFLTAAGAVVPDTDTVQLTALATFRFEGEQEVTAATEWTVDPPNAGSVDADGVFTPAAVVENTCATISAAFTHDGVTRTGLVSLTIVDADFPVALKSADPPSGAIDARWPVNPENGLPAGWRTIDITLNGPLCSVLPSDFQVEQLGGSGVAPSVTRVDPLTDAEYRITLNRAVEPGARTSVTHVDTAITVRLGFLPSDVNQDGTSDADDIRRLVDSLQGVGSPLEEWATDIDRSGRTLQDDLLALVDLLRGTNSSPGWYGESLP